MSQLAGNENQNDGNNDNDEKRNANDKDKNNSKELGLNVDASNKGDLLRVTVVSPEYEGKMNDEDRLGVVLCCVVDISGSMSTEATIKDEKGNTESHGLTILDLVKHSIKTIIHCLNKNDQLSIISYANKSRIELPLTKMTEAGRKKALDKLEGLHAGGGTNLWDGLESGLNELQKCDKISMLNGGVLLFTDGLPNIRPGNGELGSLDKYIETNKNSLPGIINTYGFGYSLDSQLLDALAIKGNGNYFFIPDSSFVGTIFVNSLSNFCCNLAKNVELSLKVDANVAYTILGGFNYTANEKNEVSNINIKLGNMMYGQNKTIMIQFDKDDENDNNNNNDKNNDNNNEAEGQSNDNNNNNNNNKGGTDSPIDVSAIVDSDSLSYVSLKNECNVNKAGTFELVNDKKLNQINYYRLLACDTIRECMEAMQLNDTKEAETILKKLIKSMTKDNLVKNNEFIKDLLKDLKGQVFEAIQSKEAYTKWGKHYLLSLMAAHLHEYNNNFKDPGVQHYGGKLFKTIKDKADEIFVGLPAPKPSRPPRAPVAAYGGGGAKKKNAAGGGGHGFANFTYNAAPVNMRAYYNASGGCIAGDCQALMKDNSLKMVKDLKSGDILYDNCEILCVLRMKCDDSKIALSHLPNGLKITPYHPVKYNNKWVFPNDIVKARIVENCHYVYNFILKNKHSMIVNGIECITLGHGRNNESSVLKHEYFGNFNKIMCDVKEMNGWNHGFVDLSSNSFKRNEANLVVKMSQ